VADPVRSRPTVVPRVTRRVTPGPRIRSIETLLLAHVAALFAAAVLAWRLARGWPWFVAALLPLLVLVAIVVDVVRLLGLRRFRVLAMTGAITMGEVLSARTTRRSGSAMADRPRPPSPFSMRRRLAVRYRFHAQDGTPHEGEFWTTTEDVGHYRPRSPIEVFFLPGDPRVHAPSAVLRWYYRLAGKEETMDETPAVDFGDDTAVTVEWIDGR
jgi:hypothetical protein